MDDGDGDDEDTPRTEDEEPSFPSLSDLVAEIAERRKRKAGRDTADSASQEEPSGTPADQSTSTFSDLADDVNEQTRAREAGTDETHRTEDEDDETEPPDADDAVGTDTGDATDHDREAPSVADAGAADAVGPTETDTVDTVEIEPEDDAVAGSPPAVEDGALGFEDDADASGTGSEFESPTDPEPGDEFEIDSDDFEAGSAAGFGPDPKAEALLEFVGETASVLLLGPLLCPADHDLCAKLTGADSLAGTKLLLVTLTQSPEERVSFCRNYLDGLPAETVVVNVGDSEPSEPAAAGGTDETVTIETIGDPSDLTRIGITIDKYLSAWRASDAASVVCFHSLTALVKFVDDTRSVFRFLHILQGRVNRSGARAHYHMDATAHDEQLIAQFRPVFDVVLSFDEDGSLSVNR